MRTLDEQLFATAAEVAQRSYDYVVVGGGCTGSVVVRGLLDRQPAARILVLEQGPYLLPDHVQNLDLGYQPLMGSAVAAPWRSDGDLDIVAQVPYLGGRTLFWSGSCPQPGPDQLRDWPAVVVDELGAEWAQARALIGVRPAGSLTPYFGGLHQRLRSRLHTLTAELPELKRPERIEELDAALALGAGDGPVTRKFSAVPLLLRALTEHPETVDVVTRCPVRRLEIRDGAVIAVHTDEGVQPVGAARVVLAMGTTEATRLTLDSLPSAPLVGTNLAGNAASWFAARVPRAGVGGLTDQLDLAALYLDASTGEREYHLHVSAAATPDPARDLAAAYHLMPDMFGPGTPQRVADRDHVVFLVHGLTEIAYDPALPSPSRISVGPDGVTVGTFRLGPADHRAWDAMDRLAEQTMAAIAAGGALEYWWPGEQSWQPTPPPDRRMPFAVHETGTLAMGASPDTSVTDLVGRVHQLANLYVTGGALFPTRGSWNPLLTMAALCLRLTRHLTAS